MKRLVSFAALGVAGSVALSRVPYPPDDPFRATLVWLPALVAGFAWLERASGGRRIPAAVRSAQAAALAVLAGLVWSRDGLALRYSDVLVDRLLAAGLALLLVHRMVTQVVALRPLLGSRLPRRPALAFMALPLLVYLSILPWANTNRPPDGDEPYYLLVTHSLAFDFDADLSNNYAAGDYRAFVPRDLEPQPGDPTGPGGTLYSRHNVLLPALLAPGYRLFGVSGALATMALLAALLAWATLRLARHYLPTRPGDALAAWAVTAFTAPVLLFSHQAWVEIPAALLTVLALDGILSALRDSRYGGRRWAVPLAAIALLPLLKLRFVLLAGPLLLLAVLGRRRHNARTAVVALLGLGSLIAAILVVNAWLFGNPLKYHRLAQLASYAESFSAYALGASGLFLDCAFGLVAAAPVWALLVPALLRRELRLPRVWGHAALVVGPYLLALAPRGEWYGAWSPPFRYGVVGLPLLGLALGPCFARRRRGLPGLVVKTLLCLTVGVTIVWIAWPEWTYNLAHGRSHLLDAASGYLGVDVVRLFPSSIRLRPATWIWPFALLLLGLLPWKRGRTAADGGAAAVCCLALVAATLAAAAWLPTRVVEAEDAWVRHSGGVVYPERWVIGRRRFRGAWSLPGRAEVTARIAPGGERVSLVLEVRKLRPRAPSGALAVRLNGSIVARIRPADAMDWQSIEVGPFRWPDGAADLSLLSEATAGSESGALVDRVLLRWE